MRSPTLFLSLALILSIQLSSISAQDAFYGVWSYGTAWGAKVTSPICCRPSSITIEPTSLSDVLLATFKWAAITYPPEVQCPALFDSPQNLTGTMLLFKQGKTGVYTANKFYSDETKSQVFNYQVVDNKLSVKFPEGGGYYEQCEFMVERHAPLPAKDYSLFIILAVFAVALLGFIGFTLLKKKQSKEISQLSFAVPSGDFNVNPGPSYGYNAPPAHTGFNPPPQQQFNYRQDHNQRTVDSHRHM